MSIVDNDIVMILEFQAVNHDFLVSIRTLLTAACAWTLQEVLLIYIFIYNNIVMILELQAENHGLLVSIKTLLTADFGVASWFLVSSSTVVY